MKMLHIWKVPQPIPHGVLHRVRSSASAFNFLYPLASSRSSSSCLLLLRLPVTSTLLSIFPSITCFRRQLVCKMWPIQLAFLLFIVGMIFISSLTYGILHFSHNRSKWYPSFSSTTLQNLPRTSDLLFEVSTFQHHTKLRSICSIWLVSSLKLSPVCRWKSLLVKCCFSTYC
jgi:hypothetical protein